MNGASLFLAIILASAACGSPTGPAVPIVHDARGFEPPSQYTLWARELMTCAGISGSAEGSVGDVAWLTVTNFENGIANQPGGSVRVLFGQYARPRGQPTIWLRRSIIGVERESITVKHEMLHHLQWPIADWSHLFPAWRCVVKGDLASEAGQNA